MSAKFILNQTVIFMSVCLFSNSVKFESGVRKRDCPHPVLRQNGSQIAFDGIAKFLSGIAEVKFNGAFDKIGSKRYCKIRCISGEWIGPLCLLDGDKSDESKKEGQFHPVLRSCSTKIFQSKFVVSHRNRTVWELRDFSHNSVVQVRCKQFGVFKLIGDAHLICHNGVWKHRIPTCVPTTSLTNYTDESAPPSVLAKVISGSASVEPTGELAVYPGSTVHLECLYLRSAGEPEWSWTSTYRTYATGWSIDPEERQWKFRLSIFYIKPQDTGIYTCSTPRGLTHSIILNVIEVHCDVAKVLTNDPNVLIQIQGSRLGQSAIYKCREGFKLKGAPSVTCQASGDWSNSGPECVPVVCPTLEVQNSTVKLIKQDFGYGGTAIFQCPQGYKLIGVATLVCLLTGEWSGTIPSCKEIFCSSPLIPQNGLLKNYNISAASSFRAGTELTFSCKTFYRPIGKKDIKCQETGVWSNPPPLCKAYCNPPDDPPNGNFRPKKMEFEIGDRISLICYKGYESTMRIRPKCMKNGIWSNINLDCKPTKTLIQQKKMNNVALTPKKEAAALGSTFFPASSTKTSTITPTMPSNWTTQSAITIASMTTQSSSLPTTNENSTTEPFKTPNTTSDNPSEVYNFTITFENDTDFFYVMDQRLI